MGRRDACVQPGGESAKSWAVRLAWPKGHAPRRTRPLGRSPQGPVHLRDQRGEKQLHAPKGQPPGRRASLARSASARFKRARQQLEREPAASSTLPHDCGARPQAPRRAAPGPAAPLPASPGGARSCPVQGRVRPVPPTRLGGVLAAACGFHTTRSAIAHHHQAPTRGPACCWPKGRPGPARAAPIVIRGSSTLPLNTSSGLQAIGFDQQQLNLPRHRRREPRTREKMRVV
jgi:hypothetical protein